MVLPDIVAIFDQFGLRKWQKDLSPFVNAFPREGDIVDKQGKSPGLEAEIRASDQCNS